MMLDVTQLLIKKLDELQCYAQSLITYNSVVHNKQSRLLS